MSRARTPWRKCRAAAFAIDPSPSGRNEAINVTLTRVRPKDRPNVVGLRNDSGPSHVPPLTSSTARWMTPLTSSRTAAEYAARSTAFTSLSRLAGCRRSVMNV